jgi:hypothetical protein
MVVGQIREVGRPRDTSPQVQHGVPQLVSDFKVNSRSTPSAVNLVKKTLF